VFEDAVQFRFNVVWMIVWVSTMLALWFVGHNACVNWSAAWWGLVPVLLAASCLQAINFYLTQCRQEDFVQPSFALQEFAWTEQSKARKLARRKDTLGACVCPQALNAPMFCFETAIKCFFWSTIMYDYTEADGHKFVNIPEQVKEVLGEIDVALGLYALEKRHLFYDRKLETKVVVAWNYSTILVCFRGTSARSNVVEDLKVLHPAISTNLPAICCPHALFVGATIIVSARVSSVHSKSAVEIMHSFWLRV
jgi:hypothetical protein